MRHDEEAGDPAAPKGLKKPRIVLEGDASVRVAARAKHVTMSEHARAAEHIAVPNRLEAQCRNTMEQPSSQLEIIGMRWSCPTISFVDIARIIEPVAQAGMGLQTIPVGHIDGVRLDIIQSSAAVEAGGYRAGGSVQ